MKMLSMPRPTRLPVAVLFMTIGLGGAGCGSGGPQMGAVDGTVVYQDGTPVHGGVAVIRFEPIGRSAEGYSKAASADIAKDGTYELQTIRPGDGALYGAYKVVFTVLDSYRSGKSLVAEEYTSGETTPLEAVVDSASHTFDFKIDRP